MSIDSKREKRTSLSEWGNQCLERIQEEISVRLSGKDEDPQVLIALLLDPRTAPLAPGWLGIAVHKENRMLMELELVDVLEDMKTPVQQTLGIPSQESDEDDDGMNMSMPVHEEEEYDDMNRPMSLVEEEWEDKLKHAQKLVDGWLRCCTQIDWSNGAFQNVAPGGEPMAFPDKKIMELYRKYRPKYRVHDMLYP